MRCDDLMAELAALGSEQTRKTYRRHGAQEPLFGVSYADLGKLQKRIKRDHALAEQLWATGNADARTLATMIADPQAMSSADLDRWAQDLNCYGMTGALVNVVAPGPHAMAKMKTWIESPSEWISRAGWQVLGALAMQDGAMTDEALLAYLPVIEARIHTAPNRTRDAMNDALIAIGIRSDALEAAASASAERIGKVVVDHGDTSCKTPDAAAYIRKTRQHRADQAAKRLEKVAGKGKVAKG